MPQSNVRKIRSADTPLKAYSPPRLVKLNFSPDQLARIEAAADPEAELAKVYREVTER